MKQDKQAMDLVKKCVTRLILKYPFYGSLALRLKLLVDWTCDTAYTDAVSLGFNPKFVLSLTNPQVMFLVAHEVLHVVLKHMLRLGGRDPRIANMAMDHTINLLLKEAGFDVIPSALCDPKYKGMAWERIYGLMYKEAEEKCTCDEQGDESGDESGDEQGNDQGGTSGDDQGDEQGGCPVHGTGVPSLEDALQNGTFGEIRPLPADKDPDMTNIEWESAITIAMNKEKSRGTMPGSMMSAIDGRNQPVVDWKDTLSAFVSDVGHNVEGTWSRCNKRLMDAGYYLSGLKREGISNLVIACDTSASVSNDELKQFASEALDICDLFGCDITFIPCDSRVHDVQCFESGEYPEEVSDFDMKGRGGTSFDPVFTWVDENMDAPTALIYFTDGECDYPDEPDYPVLWGISNGSWFKDAPWGETVRVELN